ncbi:phosphoadenosine phosphosulfate reductase family protein [Mesobacillus subterraneus]|uniref:phosphoadenosine phosphosulfate reductase domain-containing protein n=1 Tax=Mesobacillus subterraneus TaxID=285983 RepID=UPI00203F305B|nr:phosphoadenosine phosphosulfate reductase family protein [Mesobacillus subterraneus]MCM3686096.1 phosphoadenosine phosphosulfate reductase family protein [Mesobacillus subterraneus]
MNKKEVCWFSGGVSSFIAAYLRRDTIDEIFYIDIDDQHPDTMRFLHDCEKALGKKITILRNDKFKTVEEVIRKTRYVNGPQGARCTLELKKQVRQEWEKQQDGEMVYVWGYDGTEKHRADRLQQTMPEYEHIFPLLDENLTKEEVHGMLLRLGIKRPAMYEMGYRNNNCIGCVKGGMGYWNKIRKDFPEVFEERARLEREIGNSCIKGVFLDELEPGRGRIDDEVMEECGIMCEIAYDKTTE